jgi:hypothetical protein
MRKLFIIMAIVSIIISSCKKKDETENVSYSIEAAEDNSLSSTLFSDVTKQVEDVHLNQDGANKSYLDSSCAVITITHGDSASNFLWKADIDFGSNGCEYNGRTRRGIIHFTTTGAYRDSGTVIHVSLENYYVDDYHIEGTKTITNMGRNADGNIYYKIEVANASITAPDGSVRTWEATRFRTWVAGENTVLNWLDDEYDITGSSSGVTRSGKTYSINITEALRVKILCKWIQDGNGQ